MRLHSKHTQKRRTQKKKKGNDLTVRFPLRTNDARSHNMTKEPMIFLLSTNPFTSGWITIHEIGSLHEKIPISTNDHNSFINLVHGEGWN